MVQDASQVDLYETVLAIDERFPVDHTYSLLVNWRCPGVDTPLVEYLGILQVGDAIAPEGSRRLYLPTILNP